MNDIHKEAKECRKAADKKCEEMDKKSEYEAVLEFEDGEIASYFNENCDYIIGLVYSRMTSIKFGGVPLAMRPFDAETMARLLSSNTEVTYEESLYDFSLSDEDMVKAWKGGKLKIFTCGDLTATTLATKSQMALRDVLLEYVEAAASYAKHIGSASLLEWAELIDILENRAGKYTTGLTSEDALRFIELEKSAVNRLRFDKIIAEIPPYKPLKPSKKGK